MDKITYFASDEKEKDMPKFFAKHKNGFIIRVKYTA
jgi:hypothetical protein